jgi:hypothetical protein
MKYSLIFHLKLDHQVNFIFNNMIIDEDDIIDKITESVTIFF